MTLPANEVEQIDPDEKEYGERMKENQNDIYEVLQSTDWNNSKDFKRNLLKYTNRNTGCSKICSFTTQYMMLT